METKDQAYYAGLEIEYEWLIENLGRVPSLSPSTLQRFPYWRHCRVCRAFFGSKRARDGYCVSCRLIIEQRTKELDAILIAAEGQSAEQQEQAIEDVKAALKCPILLSDGYPCEWEGNGARIWPKTISSFSDFLCGFVERHQRHVYEEHCFPGRFGLAGQRRAQRNFEKLCDLPEHLQPESVKSHLRTVSWLKEQGITPAIHWSLLEPPPRLLTRRARKASPTKNSACSPVETF